MTQRTQRIDELIRQEIGAIIARDIADPRIGFVTITEVETTPDLSHAKVWVSFIGSADERSVALRALGRAMPFIRHELGSRLRLRRIPELHLEQDDTLARGTRVLQLINDLNAGIEPTGEGPVDDSLPTPVARLPHAGDVMDSADTNQAGPTGSAPDRPETAPRAKTPSTRTPGQRKASDRPQSPRRRPAARRRARP